MAGRHADSACHSGNRAPGRPRIGAISNAGLIFHVQRGPPSDELPQSTSKASVEAGDPADQVLEPVLQRGDPSPPHGMKKGRMVVGKDQIGGVALDGIPPPCTLHQCYRSSFPESDSLTGHLPGSAELPPVPSPVLSK